MIQQGQVFKLRRRVPTVSRCGRIGTGLRVAARTGRRSVGSRRALKAEKALRKVLDRLGPGGGRATITLAEFVDEYLEMHQAEPVTIAKLRWLLSKATAVLGEKRLGAWVSNGVCAVRWSEDDVCVHDAEVVGDGGAGAAGGGAGGGGL